jgi:hypothetical protein
MLVVSAVEEAELLLASTIRPEKPQWPKRPCDLQILMAAFQ